MFFGRVLNEALSTWWGGEVVTHPFTVLWARAPGRCQADLFFFPSTSVPGNGDHFLWAPQVPDAPPSVPSLASGLARERETELGHTEAGGEKVIGSVSHSDSSCPTLSPSSTPHPDRPQGPISALLSSGHP